MKGGTCSQPCLFISGYSVNIIDDYGTEKIDVRVVRYFVSTVVRLYSGAAVTSSCLWGDKIFIFLM